MGQCYFKDVVLPSVGMTEKGSYTIPEACNILGCSRTKLWRMSLRGELLIAPNKRIYLRELQNYYNQPKDKKPKT